MNTITTKKPERMSSINSSDSSSIRTSDTKTSSDEIRNHLFQMRITESEYQELKSKGKKETQKSAAAWVRKQIFFKPDHQKLKALYVDMRRIRSELLLLKRRLPDPQADDLAEIIKREEETLEASLEVLRQWFAFVSEGEDGNNETGTSERVETG